MAHELKNALDEVRKAHPGLWREHIKKLLTQYTISEIKSGTIKDGVFYPIFEVGKQWGIQRKQPLTHLRLWQPRKHHQ